MQKTLVFVPVSAAEAELVAKKQPLGPRRAFTVTDELMAALGYDSDLREDAEYAAMVIASVAGLTAHRERVVLVAEVDEGTLGEVTDAENGELRIHRLDPDVVVAFFADAPGTDVAAAAAAVHGTDVDEAWEHELIQELLNANDLLWHGAEELGTMRR